MLLASTGGGKDGRKDVQTDRQIDGQTERWVDLWTEKSLLANFADDTQTIVINNNLEKALNITSKEANNIISFFGSNNLVNNPEKAALLYNSKGKSGNITVENIHQNDFTLMKYIIFLYICKECFNFLHIKSFNACLSH